VRDGCFVVSNIIYSQVDIHKSFGGVVPEIAARNHLGKIDYVVSSALSSASVTLNDIDAVAVTYGPGLVGALLVGVNFAKGLAFSAGLPLVGVNHIKGHIASAYLLNDDLYGSGLLNDDLQNQGFKPPFVALVVSGGHSHLFYVKDYLEVEVLGKTQDDAAGEAFDKVARTLGLPYPGGVQVDRLAKSGDRTAIKFPRSWLGGSLDFSFSGIKSAVLNYLNAAKMKGEVVDYADIAASFQEAVVEVLVKKALDACEVMNCKKLAVVGGVACNSRLREVLADKCAENGILLHIPKPVFCTDNAAMIAAAGYHYFKTGKFAGMDLNAVPGL
jgi:N6-L-threonylcarbamoyladenine synthase